MANVQGAEWEAELEDEFESQLEAHELGAHESHETHETHELESEFETGEQFFGRIARGIGSFVRRAAPILRQVARVAAPMVGTAVGGPFGAILGRVASQALGESELEGE